MKKFAQDVKKYKINPIFIKTWAKKILYPHYVKNVEVYLIKVEKLKGIYD